MRHKRFHGRTCVGSCEHKSLRGVIRSTVEDAALTSRDAWSCRMESMSESSVLQRANGHRLRTANAELQRETHQMQQGLTRTISGSTQTAILSRERVWVRAFICRFVLCFGRSVALIRRKRIPSRGRQGSAQGSALNSHFACKVNKESEDRIVNSTDFGQVWQGRKFAKVPS